MDSEKRLHTMLDQISDQEKLIRAHLESLENLEAETSFDLDIASDIQPGIIDIRNQEGRNQAKFYQDLYGAIADKKRYIAIARFTTGTPRGACIGFGQEPEHDLRDVYVRIYRDLPESAIKFESDEDGVRVVIDYPGTVFGRKDGDRDHVINPNRAILFDQTTPDFWSLDEQHIGTPIIASSDTPGNFHNMLERSSEFGKTTMRSNALGMDILRWTSKELRERGAEA